MQLCSVCFHSILMTVEVFTVLREFLLEKIKLHKHRICSENEISAVLLLSAYP